MTVRATSKAAILELRDGGKLGTKCRQIINYVARNPGCTRKEIADNVPGMTINCVSGRVHELLKSGDLFESGCKHDEITGRSVNLLFVTDYQRAA